PGESSAEKVAPFGHRVEKNLVAAPTIQEYEARQTPTASKIKKIRWGSHTNRFAAKSEALRVRDLRLNRLWAQIAPRPRFPQGAGPPITIHFVIIPERPPT